MKNICYESNMECNLKCDYCISSDNSVCGKKILDYKEIIATIASFEPRRVVVSGGEPLLDDKILEKLELLRRECRDSFISLSTNGAVDYDYYKLKTLVDCVDFSLPALTPKKYEEMRGKDCVKVVIGNIDKAVLAGLNLRLSYTLTKVNYDELDSILQFAEEKNIGEVRIGRYFPFRDAQACASKYELSWQEIKRIVDGIDKDAYSFRIVPPIENLELMEAGYLNINCFGEIFTPTRKGKNILGNVGDCAGVLKNAVLEKQNEIFHTTNMNREEDAFSKILNPKRMRGTSVSYKRIGIEEYYSDRSRIIYSQAFRRLQQKAQVFSLETNSSVRSRLTHSIEVSDVGRLMAKKIVDKLKERTDEYKVSANEAEMIIAIVENACLLHDIGNPPFGHFGEAAIQKWWRENYSNYIEIYNKRASEKQCESIAFTSQYQKKLLNDIAEFDGNPQGLRNILRLRKDEDISREKEPVESGLNLTYQTILSCVKYVKCAGEEKKNRIEEALQKKAGYFQTEKELLDKVYNELGLQSDRRFPFVYIMEAADDISYCMSDVADSIEKELTTLKQFVEDFKCLWKELFNQEIPECVLSKKKEEEILQGKIKDFNMALASEWAAHMTDDAAKLFVDDVQDYYAGTKSEVINEQTDYLKILKVIGEYSRRNIYSAAEAEQIEIAGYSIILGLLRHFGQLLVLTYDEFQLLLDSTKNPKKYGLEVEARIVHLLGEKYISSYRNQLQEWDKKNIYRRIKKESVEWWLRAHLLVDHVSGMTDDFALKTYQLCNGINVKIF